MSLYNYKVLRNEKVTDTVRVLTLERDAQSVPLLFRPGQYVAIGLRDQLRPTVMRCFSIASSPSNQQVVQLSMRIKGHFTSALERLKPDSRVALRGPFGGFVFNESIHPDIVFFAGGIGIAPFMSMVRYATELSLTNRIHLVYSCRDQKDIAFFDEIQHLNNLNPHLNITYVIGDGKTDRLKNANVIVGQVDPTTLAQLKLEYSKQVFFVCGPPPYMNALFTLLKTHGVPEEKIISEAFSQGSHRQTGKLVSWPFNMYALTGLSFIAGALIIVSADLNKTIPQIESEPAITHVDAKDVIVIQNGDMDASIASLKPQVDTTITQKPIVDGQSSSSSTVIPSPTTTAAPTIIPSPTTTPITPPRTTVS